MRSSPSLYEGAFRLETAGAGSLFPHPALGLFPGQDGKAREERGEDPDSPLSSPVDESYKIRIGPRGSLSPRSHEDEESKHEESEAQDLSLGGQQPAGLGLSQEFCKMEEESGEEMAERSEDAEDESGH